MKNFAEFTRKNLCWNLFFDNVKRCRSATSLKARLQRRVLQVNFAKFSRAAFLQNTTGRPLLNIAVSIVAKAELTNESVNYDTKTKAHVPK